jgi:hypothetical protein
LRFVTEALTIKLLIFLRDDGSATWADFTEAEALTLDAWACGATLFEVPLFDVLLLEGTALEGTPLSATGAAVLAAAVFPLRSTFIPKTMTISKAKMVKTTVAERSRFGVRLDDSSLTLWGISSETSVPTLTNTGDVGC